MYKNVHHITAGAGAGKTTKLVGIISALINEGADPQRMILSTYTDAAATEFREKSKAALSPDKAIKMNGALMGTMHSIASRYVKRYWYLLDISPSVKAIDKSISKVLMNRSLDSLMMDGHITGEQKATLNKYVETFSLTKGPEGYDYDFWKSIVSTLFDKMREYGFEENKIPGFKEKTLALLHNTFNLNHNIELFEQAKPCFQHYIGFKTIIDNYGTDAGKKQYEINMNQLTQLLSIDPMNVDIKTLKSIRNKKDGGGMTWYKVVTDRKKCPSKDQYDDAIEKAKEAVNEAVERLSGEMVPMEYTQIFNVAELLFDIMDSWIDAYDKIKKENGVIDYADMEEYFLRLLKKEEVLEDIRNSVDYLFVDEFQDATPIQATIYDILSNQVEQSWFVGDRKQAIYGFSGSDPSLIAELAKFFPLAEKDASSFTDFKKDNNGNSSEILGTSHRSVPKLVIAANTIFEPAFAEANGTEMDIIPANHVTLKPKKDKKDNPWDPLYHIVCNNGATNPSFDENALATFICKIAESQDFKNAYSYSDIAILTRTGDQAKRISKALVEKSIPTGFVNPDDFQDTPEVSLVLSILRLSEGIDKEKCRAEIRKLVLNEDIKTLSAKVGKRENNLDDIKGLEDFAKSLRSHSVPDRINEIITRFDMQGTCGQWRNPDSRRGKLNLLRNAADVYVDMSSVFCAEANAHGFLSFLKDYKPDPNSIKFDNSAEGVKVLTYHKSKGLDWKIVILCGLDDYKEKEIIDSVSIIGSSTNPDSIIAIPRLPDKKPWVKECIRRNPEFSEILDGQRKKALGEEKRLLYVGFTRAKEVVITAAIDTNPEVLQVLCPTVRNRVKCDPIDDSHVDIWGIPSLVSRYEVCTDNHDLKVSSTPTPKRYKNAGFMLTTTPKKDKPIKYHSPSKYKDPEVQAAAIVETVKDFGFRTDIPHGKLNDNVFGDCIHHIFASCAPGKHETNLAVAASTLKGFGIQETDAPEKAVTCIEAFFGWLTDTYGSATSLGQEVPFQYTDANGQVFSGNMDLVWRTDKGCVLVDFKTFPGAKSELFKKESDHWAGKYASQLGIYSDALSACGWGKPLDCLLFYPVEGLVIRCN